jgi:hypothetical protein
MRDNTKSSTPEDSERSLPFFARFLKGKDTPEVSVLTLKYPSDRDEIDQRFEYMPGNNEPHK